jgi:hypothetical protein
VVSEPWGWAPFHYGRWCYVRDHWGWVPGPIVVRPVYAPALVGFVGGGGFSVSFGGGLSGVAWFPLGPRDVFVPGYRCSARYVQIVNVTNTRGVNVAQVTNVYNTVIVNHQMNRVDYMYANNERAVTAVSRDTFVNARPVASAAVRVNADQIRSARVVDSAPIAPTRASYVSATAHISNARPAVPFAQRPVVARLNPATPVQRRAPQYTNDSRPFSQQPANQQQNFRGSNNPPANNNQPPSRDGFRPFQPPAGANASNPPPAGNNANRGNAATSFNGAAQQPQSQARPTVTYAPPQKARDDMYDVHPPLNRQTQTPPPKQQPHQQPENKKDEHH